MPVLGLKRNGDRKAARKLRRLGPKLARKLLKPGYKLAAKLVHTEMLLNLSGRLVRERTGTLVNAMEKMKPKILRARVGNTLAVGIFLPSREDIGVPTVGKQAHYGAVLQHGSATLGIPAFGWATAAVDDRVGDYVRIIKARTKIELEKEARKK